MKVIPLLLLICIVFVYSPSYAQQDTIKVKSVEEAIDHCLHSFRKQIANDKAIIYNIVEVSLNENNIDFARNDFFVKNSINASRIDYKTDKFLLKFVVSIDSGRTFISVIQWGLKKRSNKEIELVNLMSGGYYEVVPDNKK